MAEGNLPIGFALSIALNKDALKNFANLDDTTKNRITDYIQSSVTGEDALEKVNVSINGLENNNLEFLN